jgi:hypothetical protein
MRCVWIEAQEGYRRIGKPERWSTANPARDNRFWGRSSLSSASAPSRRQAPRAGCVPISRHPNPDDIILRSEGAAKPNEDDRRICVEIMQEVAGIQGVSGVHVTAFKQGQYIGEMVETAEILGTRRPVSRRAQTS